MHTEQGVQIRLTRVNRVTRVTRREFFGGKCLVEKISGNIFVRKQSAFREGRKYKEAQRLKEVVERKASEAEKKLRGQASEIEVI